MYFRLLWLIDKCRHLIRISQNQKHEVFYCLKTFLINFDKTKKFLCLQDVLQKTCCHHDSLYGRHTVSILPSISTRIFRGCPSIMSDLIQLKFDKLFCCDNTFLLCSNTCWICHCEGGFKITFVILWLNEIFLKKSIICGDILTHFYDMWHI